MSGPDVVVDTNVFVSARNRREAAWHACRAFLDGVDRGAYRGIVSTISLAELRVGFRDAEVPSVWRPMLSHLLTSPHYAVAAVSPSIAEQAGSIRARHRITLPDAIIVATAVEYRAKFIVSEDRELGRRQPEVPVRRASDVAATE